MVDSLYGTTGNTTLKYTSQYLNRGTLKVLEKVPTKFSTAVIKPQLAVNLVNLVHIILVQSKVTFEVGLDSRGRLGLGENGIAFRDSPGCTSQHTLLVKIVEVRHT